MGILRSGTGISFIFLWMINAAVLSATKPYSVEQDLKIRDYIIVGAGAAGATIASRLSEDQSVTVCLFEAGITDTSPDVASLIETPRLFGNLRPGPITYNYSSVPQKGLNGRTLDIGMGKTLGGSTSHKVMGFFRGFGADFDHREANGADGWGFKDVLPFFLKIENILVPDHKDSPFHSTCGPFAVSQDPKIKNSALHRLLKSAAKETGMPVTDCNEPYRFGVCAIQTAVKNGVRETTSTAYLRPVSRRRNLFIVTEALVEKILISAYSKRAYGIRYSKGGRKYEVKARREIIVSGGSYGSVQLLQLSGVGPAPLLRKLKDQTKSTTQCWRNSTTVVVFFLHPKSRGTVQIKSKNPMEPPAIDARYLQEESDIKDIVDAVRNLQRIIATSLSMKAVNASVVPSNVPESCNIFKQDSDDLWKCLIRSSATNGWHPVSTCRMGTAWDKNSVVDSKLRVHGIKSLRVADASIMPEVTSAFTMAPTIMIGEKAADMIKYDT